jgi:hypothetical protein
MGVQMARHSASTPAPLQHLQQTIPTQTAVLSQPHPRQVGQTVARPSAQIAVEIAGSTDTEEHDPGASTLADQPDCLALEVQFFECHCRYLASAQASVEHQPQDRGVTAILERRPAACVEQTSLLVICEDVWCNHLNLGGPHADHRRQRDLSLSL